MFSTIRTRSVGSMLAAILLGVTAPVNAETSAGPNVDVTAIDIDQLMNVNVSIASKRPEPFARIPAAVYVILGDDLKRGGVHTLAEAMRMVPGFHVERSRANVWQLSARGFNGDNANKLLVLVDGRTVYSNLQSGVYWDVQNTLLDNVDRIEVVRGPGGTLWGTNAVNGVVNIITKRADETPGGLLKLAAGRELRHMVDGRYGFALNEHQSIRISGQASSIDESAMTRDPQHQLHDGFDMRRADFRSDWAEDEDKLRVQGEVYDGNAQTQSVALSLAPASFTGYNDSSDLGGGHLIGDWERALGPDSILQLRTYYDYVSRKSDLFADRLHTGDVEAQYRAPLRAGHDVVLGAGYRLLASNVGSSFVVSLTPENRKDSIWSLFAQDEITLREDRLWLTLGTRVERNDYSGFEFLPNARLAYAVDDRSTAWLAMSRSVRSPSLLDIDFRVNTFAIDIGVPVVAANIGTEHFQPEQLYAIESGYRTRPVERLSLDVAVFANFYNDLRSFTAGAQFMELTPAPAHLVFPLYIVNQNRARSYGAELAADLQLKSWWMLRASYTHLSINVHQTGPTNDGTAALNDRDQGMTPRNQIWLRSSMNLPHNLTLDLTGRYVGSLATSGVPRYTEADLRVAWLSRHGTEIALVGQNLLHSEHEEYTESGGSIERDVSVQVTYRFE